MHGSAIEWTMFLISMLSVTVAYYVRRMAARDLNIAICGEWTEIAIIVARGNLFWSTLTLIMCMFCAATGLYIVLIPPPPGFLNETARIKLICLIVIMSLSVIRGFSTLWYRRKILTLTDRELS